MNAKQPEAPSLEYCFTISADVAAPLTNGPGRNGERKHIRITGGRVSGSKLSGRILPGGSDWLWQRPDGTAEVQAHYTVEADDGALIYVRNFGLRVAEEAVRGDLIAGKPVDPSRFYFRASPVFDAPDGPHQWLRERIFICSVMPRKDGVEVEVFCVN